MQRNGQKIGWHAAWAMAVGGMIGGGIYTLAGVLLATSGALAWVSLVLGSLVALVTARSYLVLSLRGGGGGVPISLMTRKGRWLLAGAMTWWLLLVYVLAMAVYSYTLGRYLGHALGVGPGTVTLLIAATLTLLVLLNLTGNREPAWVQIVAVWLELSILGALAATGISRWNPEHLTQNVPSPSVFGVVAGTAATFIAFEGFEMVAYDVRELKRPRQVLGTALPAAIVAVAAAYSLVTVGAASLVGAGVLVDHQESALAAAGLAAWGRPGLVIVTVAACASAISAVNATLFSVGRLARSAGASGLLPSVFARVNSKQCPVFSIVCLGVATAVLASFSSLRPLVESASLVFLLLFAFVNALALVELRSGRASSRTEARSMLRDAPRQARSAPEDGSSRWAEGLAFVGTVAAVACAILVARSLAMSSPRALLMLAVTSIVCLLVAAIRLRTRARGSKPTDPHLPGSPDSGGYRDLTPPPSHVGL